MIDSNSLLQADATVITGILILLTVHSLKPLPLYNQHPSIREINQKINKVLAILVVSTIAPFSLSAALTLSEPTFFGLATDAAISGFIYLIWAVAIVVMLPPRRPSEE
jgi:hypothetical protein